MENVDLIELQEIIRNNTGNNYYSISTKKYITPGYVNKMTNVNHEYKLVASKGDKQLFAKVILTLQNSSGGERIVQEANQSLPNLTKAIEIIRLNKGPDYYNLSTGQMVKVIDIDIMMDINNKYYVVAHVKDVKFFIHVIEVLKQMDQNRITENTIKPQEDIPNLENVHKKHKNIPAKVRQLVWRKYVGSSMDGKCWCCDGNIANENWHAGHVIPESKGGPTTVENLRPLCASCNLSMSDKHMGEFITEYNFHGQGALEFNKKPVEIQESNHCTIC